MTIDAPAKVNLVLRILGRRSDGYHEIETLMVPLALADEVSVSVSEGSGVHLECDDPGVPGDAGNLAARAAVVFAERTGREFRTEIALKKRIPTGAGLGGGSSDAASVLLALNGLLGTGLEVDALEAMAAELGSDVTFFIRGKAAWCRGRGELIDTVDNVPGLRLLMVKPPFPVPTAWAYQAWSACGGRGVAAAAGTLELVNDFEPAVFGKYVLLSVMKDWLARQDGVAAVMMSGSGSTLFAVIEGAAEGIEERVRGEFGPHVWMCRTRTAGNG